ncbi:formate dehydrogenase accessory sulfurtransferase FdhD [Acidisoma cellulosilytica]|uniref:Sulfur carrier protein FdhD n=1 Tax=Acidisoma cellulosilyticum TaxID=2802395 RepID=A0A964E5S1_9PROT|nr:formate dehydrogenase accessory sulfurtransferase FdhD [Acidisoma cellulosilyticum]MCB8882975.1 formate dehydrogenase accessory sulfurtransferase FdhD [Acidisoma cellulosilyticum]
MRINYSDAPSGSDPSGGEAENVPAASASQNALAWRGERFERRDRILPEETPIAIVYNGLSHAVMMATPQDLLDFALGFTLNERIVRAPGEIEEIEVFPAPRDALQLRLWIAEERMEALDHRRRHLTGAMGCGLCGLESLEEATRPPPSVPMGLKLRAEEVAAACAALSLAQQIGHLTRAVHAAGYWMPGSGMVAVREDVGRHNALDKLAGTLVAHEQSASVGVLVMTSRVSIELIQKAATMGVQVLAAVSAPTLLAVREAEATGMTLIGIARDDGFEVFTHAERILGPG